MHAGTKGIGLSFDANEDVVWKRFVFSLVHVFSIRQIILFLLI